MDSEMMDEFDIQTRYTERKIGDVRFIKRE